MEKNVQIFRKFRMRLAREPKLPMRQSRPDWDVIDTGFLLYFRRKNIMTNTTP